MIARDILVCKKVQQEQLYNYQSKQADWVNEQSTKINKVGWVNVPTLMTNIFAAATNRSNIHNKTGGTCH
jgi:hypothetical protein